jgi:hypothetical protein
MAIHAVILDIGETLVNRQRQLIQDARALISQLRYWNINVFFATNDYAEAVCLHDRLHLSWSNFLFPDRVGGEKGTRRFIQYVTRSLEVPPQTILYVGDSEHDFYEALSGGALFFAAHWANPALDYGIPVSTPNEFLVMIKTFFLTPPPWYYCLDAKDGLERDVIVRTLLPADLSKVIGLTPFIKSDGALQVKPIRGFSGERYLLLHLLATLALTGLPGRAGDTGRIWCLYPAHDGHYGKVLDDVSARVACLLGDRYQRALLVRHAAAPSSSQTRIAHGMPTVDTQLQTLHLDPALKSELAHQTVLVVDDFTTDAYGFETARNFLLNAGASSVISLAVAKYGSMYHALAPKPGIQWDSFAPAPLRSEHFFFTGLTE